MHIMVVDIDDVERMELINLLHRKYPKHEILGFSDPLLAVQDAYRVSPDKVFAAYDMRRMDGRDMTRMMRQRSKSIEVNVIVGNESEKEEVIKSGADGWIMKPFGQSDIKVEREPVLMKRGVRLTADMVADKIENKAKKLRQYGLTEQDLDRVSAGLIAMSLDEDEDE